MTAASFYVSGRPAPKGSKRYVGKSRRGRAILIESSKAEKPWSERVRHEARKHAPETPHDGPVEVDLNFHMPRPQRGAERLFWHVKRPDADKLARSVLDAMSGVFFTDDSRVSQLRVRKRYATDNCAPGVRVAVRPMEHTA